MDYKKIKLKVSENESGKRLDVFIYSVSQSKTGNIISRSKAETLIEDNLVKVNKLFIAKPGYKIKLNDLITINYPITESSELLPDKNIKLDIIYEDQDIIVINKPAHLVVHPGAGRKDGTLVNGLVAYLGNEYRMVGHPLRPGIVHRLDSGTSGLMVVAKNENAYQNLINQFKPPRTIHRSYLAICSNIPKNNATGLREYSGVIEKALSRDVKNRKRMAINQHGKSAKTYYRTEKKLKYGYLLRLDLDTGRTHQIRIHLKSALAPILGDPVYGPNTKEIPNLFKPVINSLSRQALHAQRLSLIHPRTNENIEFSSNPPEDFLRILTTLS